MCTTQSSEPDSKAAATVNYIKCSCVAIQLVAISNSKCRRSPFWGRISELLTFKICHIPELRDGDSHPWGPLAGQGSKGRAASKNEGERGSTVGAVTHEGLAAVVPPPPPHGRRRGGGGREAAGGSCSFHWGETRSHRAPPAPIGGSPAPPGATPVGHQLPD